jgi:hypothetical protein
MYNRQEPAIPIFPPIPGHLEKAAQIARFIFSIMLGFVPVSVDVLVVVLVVVLRPLP